MRIFSVQCFKKVHFMNQDIALHHPKFHCNINLRFMPNVKKPDIYIGLLVLIELKYFDLTQQEF